MRPCDVCLRRGRTVGGNASCPMYAPALVWIDNPRREIREPESMAWPKHLKLYPTGCGNFRAGDLRRPPAVAEGQESLL